jgi:hypothetical protein
MSRTSIHISIPQPCHESWDSMDKTERGAFCHSCQKEVIDFSAMTDREVIEYLSKNKLSCARYRTDQLNTKLTIPKVDNGMFRWRALFLSFLSLISIKNIIAQSSYKPTTNQYNPLRAQKKDSIQQPISDTVILQDVICSSTIPRAGFVQGLSIEMNQIKPSSINKNSTDEKPIHKHKVRDWFRRTFRIKHKD